jgi:hypothetical protein
MKPNKEVVRTCLNFQNRLSDDFYLFTFAKNHNFLSSCSLYGKCKSTKAWFLARILDKNEKR